MTQTQGAARGLLDAARDSQPGAYALATVVSIAARVEPALVRKARTELLPHLSAGDEADLWFGPLVQARSPLAIVFAPETAELLRLELARDQTLLRRARAVVRLVHANASPVVDRVEEEVTYLALSDEPDAAERIRALLLSAARAMVEEGDGRGLAQWALRALPRLPEGARNSEAAWALAVGAGARLGGRRILGGEAPGAVPQSMLRWVLPREHRPAKVGVRLVEAGVEIGEPPAEGAHVITLPKTDPLLLEVFWGESESRQLALRPGETRVVETGPLEEIGIRTPTGDAFTVRREYEFDVFVSASSPLQGRLIERLNGEDWHGRPFRVAASEPLPSPHTGLEEMRGFVDYTSGEQEVSRKARRASRKVVEEAGEYELAAFAATASRSPAAGDDDPRVIRVYAGIRDIPPEVREYVHVDFRDEPRFEENFRRLLALIKDEPYVEPPKWAEPVKVFYVYSHGDEQLRQLLESQLAPLKSEGLIEEWSDRNLRVGGDWDKEIDERIKSTDLFLMLMSPNFLASEMISEEIERALARQRERAHVRIVPVILLPCDWYQTPLGGFHALPADGRPLASREDMEEALRGVVEGIREAAEIVAREKEAPKEPEEPSRPRVYISHSARDEDSVRLLGALDETLRAEGFDVLVDRERLQPGTTWSNESYAEVERADAALLLLSRSTLDSRWMLREVSPFVNRKQSDESFLLLPILLEGFSYEDLRRLSPALANIQALIAERPPGGTARRVVEALRPLKNRGPREPSYTERLESRVGERLRNVPDEAIFEQIEYSGLRLESQGESYKSDPREALARHIVQGGLFQLSDRLSRLASYSQSEVLGIIDLVAPTWINPAAAAAVRRVATLPPYERVLYVNCRQLSTAQIYVNRASERWPPWRTILVPHYWEESDKPLTTRLKELLRAELSVDEQSPDSVLEKILSTREEAKEPLFVIFQVTLSSSANLAMLTSEFPTLTLFLMGNEQMFDPGEFQGYAKMIYPALEPGEEERALQEYTRLRAMFQRRSEA